MGSEGSNPVKPTTMWISKHEWELAQRKIKSFLKEIQGLYQEREGMIQIITSGNKSCADTIQRLRDRIHWLEVHFPIAADSLIFAYTIDGVTFKSKHMSLLLPAGKQVLLTIKGSGKDSTGAVVDAPVTGIKLSVSGPGLGSTDNGDGTFLLKYLSDDTGSLSASANNSLGSTVSGTDSYVTGGTTPPPPVVADSLNFTYGDITDIPA